jgi:CRISPR-associated protein Cmr4
MCTKKDTSPGELKQYYAITLDPLHVGAGSSRLGRVDLPIIREPGTNLPKVPGTSLSGPARAYTALANNRYVWKDGKVEYWCAGSGGTGGEKHCGQIDPACPVCIPYGFSKGSGSSMQGLAQFFDAHILFFPVASMIGPVWVTSPSALQMLELKENPGVPGDGYCPLGEKIEQRKDSRLNFGWLMLPRIEGANIEAIKTMREKLKEGKIPATITENSVLVSDRLFFLIVNNNLEVRTSVSIDPATGAAEDKALFTFEALPRGTVLVFDIYYRNGLSYRINNQPIKEKEDGKEVDCSWVKKHVEEGLSLFATLGIGGMNTRGMGRLKVLNLDKEREKGCGENEHRV